MIIEKNDLSDVPKAPMNIDDLSDLPYIPQDPLPKKSFAMYIIGTPSSGKTNLLMSMFLSHSTKKRVRPKYYWKYFDKIYFISASLETIPISFLKKIPEDQVFNQYSDELMQIIIQELKNGENENSAIVLDDSIKDLKRSKILSKLFLNRRHCTQNGQEEGQSGLSIFVTSQKYTLLPLEVRGACSQYIIFKSSNRSEVNRIKEELMFDLDPQTQDEVLNEAWKEPYSFLMIDVNKPRDKKYYKKFDRIIFEDE